MFKSKTQDKYVNGFLLNIDFNVISIIDIKQEKNKRMHLPTKIYIRTNVVFVRMATLQTLLY